MIQSPVHAPASSPHVHQASSLLTKVSLEVQVHGLKPEEALGVCFSQDDRFDIRDAVLLVEKLTAAAAAAGGGATPQVAAGGSAASDWVLVKPVVLPRGVETRYRYGIFNAGSGAFLRWENLRGGAAAAASGEEAGAEGPSAVDSSRKLVPLGKTMALQDVFGELEEQRVQRRLDESAETARESNRAKAAQITSRLKTLFGPSRKLLLVTYSLPVILRKDSKTGEWSAAWVEDDFLARTSNSIANDVPTVWVGAITRDCFDLTSLPSATPPSSASLSSLSCSQFATDPAVLQAAAAQSTVSGADMRLRRDAEAPVGERLIVEDLTAGGLPLPVSEYEYAAAADGDSVVVSISAPSDKPARRIPEVRELIRLANSNSSSSDDSAAGAQDGPDEDSLSSLHLTKSDVAAITRTLNAMNAVPLFIPTETREAFDCYFFSVLRPCVHNVLETGAQRFFPYASSLAYLSEGWKAYQATNDLFARELFSLYRPGDVCWLNDYHLSLVPQTLVRLCAEKGLQRPPQAFFIHSPFPTSEIFRTLPVRDELLRGMLECDVVGFHTFNYARHFLQSVKRLLGVPFQSKRGGSVMLDVRGRDVMVAISHVGVEAEALDRWMASNAAAAVARHFAQKYRGRVVIGGIDSCQRLSGIALKMLAFERLLEENPVYRKKVVLVQRCEMRQALTADMRKTATELRERVLKIRATYGPEVLDYEEAISYPSPYRIGLFHRADILALTSIREGLNMTPLEYCYARTQWQMQRAKAYVLQLQLANNPSSSLTTTSPAAAAAGVSPSPSTTPTTSASVSNTPAAVPNATSSASSGPEASPGAATTTAMAASDGSPSSLRRGRHANSGDASSSPASSSSSAAAASALSPSRTLSAVVAEQQSRQRSMEGRTGSSGPSAGSVILGALNSSAHPAAVVGGNEGEGEGQGEAGKSVGKTSHLHRAATTGSSVLGSAVHGGSGGKRDSIGLTIDAPRQSAHAAHHHHHDGQDATTSAAGGGHDHHHHHHHRHHGHHVGGENTTAGNRTSDSAPDAMPTGLPIGSGAASASPTATTSAGPTPLADASAVSEASEAEVKAMAIGMPQYYATLAAPPSRAGANGAGGRKGVAGLFRPPIAPPHLPSASSSSAAAGAGAAGAGGLGPSPSKGGVGVGGGGGIAYSGSGNNTPSSGSASSTAGGRNSLASQLAATGAALSSGALDAAEASLLPAMEGQAASASAGGSGGAATVGSASPSVVSGGGVALQRGGAGALRHSQGRALGSSSTAGAMGLMLGAAGGGSGGTTGMTGLGSPLLAPQIPIPVDDAPLVAPLPPPMRGGCVMISEFSTASHVLNSNILLNPWSIGSVARELDKALLMPDHERSFRQWRDYQYAVRNPAGSWSRRVILDAIEVYTERQQQEDAAAAAALLPTASPGFAPVASSPGLAPLSPSTTPLSAPAVPAGPSALSTEHLVNAYRSAKRRVIVIDYGGTLVGKDRETWQGPSIKTDFTIDGYSKQLPPAVLESLAALSADPMNHVYVISGLRTAAIDALHLSRLPCVGLAAENGMLVSEPAALVGSGKGSLRATRSQMGFGGALLEAATPNPTPSGADNGSVALLPSASPFSASRTAVRHASSLIPQRVWQRSAVQTATDEARWQAVKAQILGLMREYQWRVNGSVVREYDYLLAWDFRNADAEWAQAQARFMAADLQSFAPAELVRVSVRKSQVEASLKAMDKGRFLVQTLQTLVTQQEQEREADGGDDGNDSAVDFLLVAGDDTTDEDLFAAAQAAAGEAASNPAAAAFVNPADLSALIGIAAAAAAASASSGAGGASTSAPGTPAFFGISPNSVSSHPPSDATTPTAASSLLVMQGEGQQRAGASSLIPVVLPPGLRAPVKSVFSVLVGKPQEGASSSAKFVLPDVAAMQNLVCTLSKAAAVGVTTTTS